METNPLTSEFKDSLDVYAHVCVYVIYVHVCLCVRVCVILYIHW